MSRAPEIVQFSLLGALGIAGAVVLYGSLTSWEQVGDGNKYDGLVTKTSNDVRLRPPRDLSWHQASPQSGFNFGDQIFVGKDSAANVQMNTVKLEISENSLLSLDHNRDVATIDLKEGGLNMALSDSKAIRLTLNDKVVSVKGNGTELTMNRHQVGDTTELGLSFSKGRGQVTAPNGEKFQNNEGQAFVFLNKPGEKIVIKKYKLKGLVPKVGAVFLQKQIVHFGWTLDGADLEDLTLEFSPDKSFRVGLSSLPVKVGNENGMDITMADTPGSYYWRLRGKTASGLRLVGQTLNYQIVELRALNLIDPTFRFVKPGEWMAGLVLEEIPYCSGYEIQVSREPTFKNILLTVESQFVEREVRFDEWGRFYLRARAVFDTIPRRPPWSESVSIDIPKPLPPPVLKKPSIVPVRKAELTWDKIPGVDFYEIQASVDSIFSHPEKLDAADPSASLALVRETPRYVRGISHQKTGVYGFPSESMILPGYVEPIEIFDAKIRPPFHPRWKKGPLAELTFSWKGKVYARGAKIEISANEEFKPARTLKATDGTMVVPLADLQDQYVRMVQLTDAHILATFSAVKVIAYPILAPLNVPTLKLPKDREVYFLPEKKAQIQLTWSSEGKLRGFDVQFAHDAEFKKIFRQEVAPEAKWVSPEPLPAGEIFWRVRGFDDFLESGWSTPRKMRISYGH